MFTNRCAETSDVRHADWRMDRWHLLHSNDHRKPKYNSVCVSNVCVLVCDSDWISELCHMLSIGTATESTKQRHYQMEPSICCQHHDILFE